jgi:hypothetical protein
MKSKFFLLGFLTVTCTAFAQTTMTVTNTNDSGDGSLRQAIIDLNNNGGGTIFVSSSLMGKTIMLESVLPEITQSMILEGNGITISGQDKRSILRINKDAMVSVSRVHFTHGKRKYYEYVDSYGRGGGGAICAFGKLSLFSCVFTHNETSYAMNGGGDMGGAVYSQGNLIVSSCTFIDNHASGFADSFYIVIGSGSIYTGNLFYRSGTVNHIVIGDSNYPASSGGYNIYHGHNWNVTAHSTDIEYTQSECPVLPTSFRPRYGSAAANVIPAGYRPTGYPTVDFYGEDITSGTLSAGAVNGMAAQGYLLNYSVLGAGTIEVTSSTRPDADGICPAGSTITLQATAMAGYRFVQWNDGNTDNPRTVTVTGDVTFTAEFDIQSGIPEIGASALSVYPNPVQDVLYVQSSVVVEQLSIHNLSGKMLKQITAPGQEVSVSDLAKGAYLVRITTAAGEVVRKIVKE